MKIELDIDEEELTWEDNAALKLVRTSESLVTIEGNKEGLISLAKQLLTIAYSDEYFFVHHEAEYNTDRGYYYGNLEEGSLELSVVKSDMKGRRNVKV